MDQDYNHLNEVIINNDFEKKMVAAFEIFDHTGNKVIDIREIPAVLCHLGCVPTKAEIDEIIQNLSESENPGNVRLSKFLPVMSGIVSKYKFHPASAEELLKAFQTLDKDNTGYLTKEYFSSIMMERGEHFSQEELDEMMAVATDSETGLVSYEVYINRLMVLTRIIMMRHVQSDKSNLTSCKLQLSRARSTR